MAEHLVVQRVARSDACLAVDWVMKTEHRLAVKSAGKTAGTRAVQLDSTKGKKSAAGWAVS